MNTKIPLVSTLLCLVSTSALAVNYPTELRITVGVSDIVPPELVIGFHNNEGDMVKFEYEMTIDGAAIPSWGVTDALRCIRSSADGNSCKGAIRGNLREPWTNEKGYRAVVLNSAKFDTDYCFRVKATTGSRDSAWTPWVCAHTPPLPARPSIQPKAPQVTLLDAGASGRGQTGAATPGRVLIEWAQNASSVGWYAVERARAGSNPVWSELGRVKPAQGFAGGELEFVETIKDPSNVPGPDNRINYRVCAANIGGKTCSSSGSYPPHYLKQELGQGPAASRTPQRPLVASQSASAAARRIDASETLSTTLGTRAAQGPLRRQANAPAATASAPTATTRPATAMQWAVTSQTQLMKQADAVALNPQPLPPKAPAAATTLRGLNATGALAPR